MNEEDYNAALPSPAQCHEYFGLFFSDGIQSKRLQSFFRLALDIEGVTNFQAEPIEGKYAYRLFVDDSEGKADVLFHFGKPFELKRERDENTRYIELFYRPTNREDDLDILKEGDNVTESRILSTPTLAKILEEPASNDYEGDYLECAVAWIDHEMAKDPLENPDSSSLTFASYVEIVYERAFRKTFRADARLYVEPIGPFRVEIQIDLGNDLSLDTPRGQLSLLPYLKMDVDLGSPSVIPHLYLDLLGDYGQEEFKEAKSAIQALVGYAKGCLIIETDIEGLSLPLASFPLMKPNLSSEEGRKRFEVDLLELTSNIIELLKK